VLSLREAAAATGVSYSTIKRRQVEFQHAYRDAGGVWRVPVSDLLGAGLHLRAKAPEPVSQAHEQPANGAELTHALARIESLTAELATERTARQRAEDKAEAEARLVAVYARSLDGYEIALRAISGPPGPPEPVAAPGPRRAAPEPVDPVPAVRRGRFRSWLLGG